MKTIGLALGLVATLVTVAQADQTGDNLRLAKLRWKHSVELARQAVGRAIDESLDKLVDFEDLDEIRALREDARAFAESGALPRGAALNDASVAYRFSRIKANEELSRAYRIAIAAYTKAKLFNEAEGIEKAFESFLLSEEEFVQGDGHVATTKTEKSIEYLKAFASQLELRIDEVASAQHPAERAAAHYAMMVTLDKTLKTRSIALRFPVEDVGLAWSGYLTVRLGPPEGFAEVPGAVDSTTLLTLRMSKAAGQKLSPGDYLVFSGIPRFGTGNFDRSGRTFAAIFFDLSIHGFDRFPKAPPLPEFDHENDPVNVVRFTDDGYSIFLPKSSFTVEHR